MARKKTDQDAPETQVSPDSISNGNGKSRSYADGVREEIAQLKAERELQDKVQEVASSIMGRPNSEMSYEQKELEVMNRLYAMGLTDAKVGELMEPKINSKGGTYLGYSFDEIDLTKARLRRKTNQLEHIEQHGEGHTSNLAGSSQAEGRA